MNQSRKIIEQIIALRTEADAVKRGYQFEQLIREILPWSERPPIAVSTQSEQIDAAFAWNSHHYLVEAKAKAEKITPGSHDWEDFELKIRKRKGFVYGLFFSLNEISEKIYETVKVLSHEGVFIVVLSGGDWENLLQSNITLEMYVNYVIGQLKFRNTPRPKNMSEIKGWFSSVEESNDHLKKKTGPLSAHFLRRFKSPYHEETYVSRKVDSILCQYANALRPSKIKEKTKFLEKSHTNVTKKMPSQIFLIRDFSGAGKTTLSVNTALSDTESFIPIVRAASQNDIDDIEDVIRDLSDQGGLNHLEVADKVIVYVIDSLDEYTNLHHSQSQVVSLLKSIERINSLGREYGLLGYPILFVFTVREEYWPDWHGIFEGSRPTIYTKSLIRK